MAGLVLAFGCELELYPFRERSHVSRVIDSYFPFSRSTNDNPARLKYVFPSYGE